MDILAVDKSPTIFARLVNLDLNDSTAIFRIAAKNQLDFETSAPKFEALLPKLLDEKDDVVGRCVDVDSDSENETIDMLFEVADPNARTKLVSGTLLGINIPVKTTGANPKSSGQFTTLPVGACRLSDRAVQTKSLDMGTKLFKVTNETGDTKRKRFIATGCGVSDDSVSMIKSLHEQGPQRLDPDFLAKAGAPAPVVMDATAQAIRKVHAGTGNMPPQSQNAKGNAALEAIKKDQQKRKVMRS